MSTSQQVPAIVRKMIDPARPIEQRIMILQKVVAQANDLEPLARLLEAAAAGSAPMIHAAQIEEMKQRLAELAAGPLRIATFCGMADADLLGHRARVVLEDGGTAFVSVPADELAKSLRVGDSVIVDVQGKAVLQREPVAPRTGELARLERSLPDGRVEVRVRDSERLVYRPSADLAERIARGEVQSGNDLVVCGRRHMAFDALPGQQGNDRFAYLSREPVPTLTLEDLGAAPAYVREMLDLVRLEMTRPELSRRYRLQSTQMKLLAGPTGTGKSYSIRALWHELYHVMSEITDTPVDELPARVIRLRMPEVLSKWLGDSDKNLDRFFDEVESLAGDPFVAPDGRRFTLPALCILEEIDGLARARGQEPIYDRILTTALQRLDTTRPELRRKLVLFVATTNVPQQVDAAFLRRVGGTIERFGRLDRRGFAEVLSKQLAGRPVAGANGKVSHDEARAALVAEVVAALYPPAHADAVQVELNYAGQADWVPRYRRDFLTASVVDRAVQVASAEASLAEHRGEAELPGLTRARVLAALDRQVRGVVEALEAVDAGDYLDLPEGARVASLRRPQRVASLPVRFETIPVAAGSSR